MTETNELSKAFSDKEKIYSTQDPYKNILLRLNRNIHQELRMKALKRGTSLKNLIATVLENFVMENP